MKNSEPVIHLLKRMGSSALAYHSIPEACSDQKHAAAFVCCRLRAIAKALAESLRRPGFSGCIKNMPKMTTCCSSVREGAVEAKQPCEHFTVSLYLVCTQSISSIATSPSCLILYVKHHREQHTHKCSSRVILSHSLPEARPCIDLS